jgi:hypothetical protein
LGHIVLGWTHGQGVNASRLLVTYGGAPSFEVIWTALGTGNHTTLALCTGLGWFAVPRLGILGLVCHLTYTTRATTLDQGIGWTRTALKRREALLVHVIWQNTEVLVETACCIDIRTDTETWTDTAALNWLQIIHFIRHILTVIQIIYGLTEWETVRVWRNVLKVPDRLLWLEAPVTNTATKIGCHNFQVKCILGVITGIRSQINVTTSNGSSGWQWFASLWLFLAIRETLTGKHKTYNGGERQRFHISIYGGIILLLSHVTLNETIVLIVGISADGVPRHHALWDGHVRVGEIIGLLRPVLLPRRGGALTQERARIGKILKHHGRWTHVDIGLKNNRGRVKTRHY